ncbi:MAG: nonstructural protein [Arizlama microvirus]|nr:MAG: nonstructural protein [Arizlama microvirus]
MKLKVFSVYDVKLKVYRFPHLLEHAGQAVRSFAEACNNNQTEMGKYPADFTLFENGEFDDQRGMLEEYKTPINLGVGISYVKIDEEQKKYNEEVEKERRANAEK